MDLGIADRVAAVAASSSGLGFAAAMELAREGARVFLCGRDAARLDAAISRIRAAVGEHGADRVQGTRLDLSRDGAAEQFAAEATSRLGPIDIVVANNGGPPPGAAVDVDRRRWEEGFVQTFLGSQRLVAASLSSMLARGWGRVVFITSTSVKQPIPGLAVSTAMRSAVAGYAKSLSDEVASRGITVNCVAPGSVLTERLESLIASRARDSGRGIEEVRAELRSAAPARRFGKPEEVAALIAFLCSERAAFITGTVIAVDGGSVRSLT